MLWQTQHGATAEEYRADCIKRGAPIPHYLNPPAALPGVMTWFLAFWELSTDRHYEGGPIPRAALMSYPVAENEAEMFRHVIREADRAYLSFLAKPIEERKSLPVAGPQILKGFE